MSKKELQQQSRAVLELSWPEMQSQQEGATACSWKGLCCNAKKARKQISREEKENETGEQECISLWACWHQGKRTNICFGGFRLIIWDNENLDCLLKNNRQQSPEEDETLLPINKFLQIVFTPYAALSKLFQPSSALGPLLPSHIFPRVDCKLIKPGTFILCFCVHARPGTQKGHRSEQGPLVWWEPQCTLGYRRSLRSATGEPRETPASRKAA